LLFEINGFKIGSFIKGPTNGKVGIEYTYTFNSTDDDGEALIYIVDWVDNSSIEYVGPSPQGVEVNATHTWTTKGTYNIIVQAKDVYDLLSPTSDLEVTIPRNKAVFNSLFLWLLERFPILRNILGLL